jgi:hypothetical protein
VCEIRKIDSSDAAVNRIARSWLCLFEIVNNRVVSSCKVACADSQDFELLGRRRVRFLRVAPQDGSKAVTPTLPDC